MAKIIVYDSTENERNAFLVLSAEHQVEFIDEQLSENNCVSDADIISIFVSSKANAKILSKFDNLGLIAARSTGFNNIDIKAANKRNIAVSTVPTYGEHTVAEYVFALTLMLTRKMRGAINQVQTAEINSDLIHGNDLYGKHLGIIGAGKIGRRVARIAKAFGMKVHISDPYVNESVITKMGCYKCSLGDLLQRSDIVTLHTPLTADTKHMMSKKQFDSIKKGAILINTARGELVDTKELVRALDEGILSAAGIDVLEDEQYLDADEEELMLTHGRPTNISLEHALEINILKNKPNVIITSHNAYNTVEAIKRINDTTVDNINNFLRSTPSNVINT